MPGKPPKKARAKITAVIVPCTASKLIPPAVVLKGPKSPQKIVAANWLKALRADHSLVPATGLYQGAGFKLAVGAADSLGAPLYVISAGLGLVSGRRRIPSYDITFDRTSTGAIERRVRGHFSSTEWWSSVSEGPYSTGLKDLIERKGDGLILIALTKAYANALKDDLNSVPASRAKSLRFFGADSKRYLPAHLESCALPFDSRLDSALPGPKATFAHRALAVFSKAALSTPFGDPERDAEWVTEYLKGFRPPRHPVRAHISDTDLRKVIRRRLKEQSSYSAMLRAIRDDEGFACEQSRLRRLFDTERARGRP